MCIPYGPEEQRGLDGTRGCLVDGKLKFRTTCDRIFKMYSFRGRTDVLICSFLLLGTLINNLSPSHKKASQLLSIFKIFVIFIKMQKDTR